MQIIKYKVKNAQLNIIASFIWHLTSNTAISDGRLLPVTNTDLIINPSTPIIYRFIDGQEEMAPPVHIRYVRQKPQIINQAAELNVWGVSLRPFGAYPLLRANMHALEGCIINLQQLNTAFCATLLNALPQISRDDEGADLIENALADWLGGSTSMNTAEIQLVQDFMKQIDDQKIAEYCRYNDIGIKRLERLIKKYTGLSPKQLQQIERFQRAGNDIIYNTTPPSLADVAYSHNYYDQMHLTREFKDFSGITPFSFLNQHDSIKGKINNP